MFNWLFKLIPADYKWSVAIKKASYAVGKLAVTGLSYGKAQAIQQKFGIHVDLQMFQNAMAAVTMAGLEAFHDWLKLHFPSVSWI